MPKVITEGNGLMICPVADRWDDHKQECYEAINKVNVMHSTLNEIQKHTVHLHKLDALDDIRDTLLSAATGKSQLETKTAMIIFKILGAVILGLIFVIVYLLTGQHFGLFNLH